MIQTKPGRHPGFDRMISNVNFFFIVCKNKKRRISVLSGLLGHTTTNFETNQVFLKYLNILNYMSCPKIDSRMYHN
jgi:hypothetical protein